MQRIVRSTVHVVHQTTQNSSRSIVLKSLCVRIVKQPRIQNKSAVRIRLGFFVTGAEVWPQHDSSDRHMVDRFSRKLNRKQSRRLFGIISPVVTDSHIVDASTTMLGPPAPPSWLVSKRESRLRTGFSLFEIPSQFAPIFIVHVARTSPNEPALECPHSSVRVDEWSQGSGTRDSLRGFPQQIPTRLSPLLA